jgi:hypothetical protein
MQRFFLLIFASLMVACGPSRSVERVQPAPPDGSPRPRPGSDDSGAGGEMPEPADAGERSEDARPPDAAGRPPDAPAPDADTTPADAAPDGNGPVLPVDAAPPETAPPDLPPPIPDAAPPSPDTAPPPPDTPPPPDALACPAPPAAADKIADFENGQLNNLAVGGRGSTAWRVISVVAGTSGAIEAAPIPELCGSRRAMHFSGTGNGARAPLIRALLISDLSGAGFFDASAYRGLLVWLRATPPGRVRLKLPDRNTALVGGMCTACNNHFLAELDADGQLRPYFLPFAEMSQSGPDERRDRLAVEALFAIEIGAPVLAGAFDLLIDDLSFVR